MRAWIAPPDTPHQVCTYISVYIRMCSLHNLQAGAWVPQGCRDGVMWWTGVYQHSHQAAGPTVWLQKCCQWWRGGGSGPQDACHVQFAGQCSAEFIHAPTYVVCVKEARCAECCEVYNLPLKMFFAEFLQGFGKRWDVHKVCALASLTHQTAVSFSVWLTACATFVQVHLPSYRHAQVQWEFCWSGIHTAPAWAATAGVCRVNICVQSLLSHAGMHVTAVTCCHTCHCCHMLTCVSLLSLFHHDWLIPCLCSIPMTEWPPRAPTQPRHAQKGRRLSTKTSSACLTKGKWVQLCFARGWAPANTQYCVRMYIV